MKLSCLSESELRRCLSSAGGLKIKIGRFNVCLSSSIREVSEHLRRLYKDFELISDPDFCDFHVALMPPFGVRRYVRPQVNFSFDGEYPFKPLPYGQAGALFEWGLNWCIARHANQYLIIHAAVVAKDSRALVLAGTPGSGKSTLCAALVCEGWRLLSDEMALLSVDDGGLYPVPRPISLKNRSLEVISAFSPDAVMGPVVRDTAKGTVGHMRPPLQSVELGERPVRPAQLVFPRYKERSGTKLTRLSKGRALLRAAENSFNYSVLGAHGFNSLARLIEDSDCHEFQYSRLDEAIAVFTELAT